MCSRSAVAASSSGLYNGSKADGAIQSPKTNRRHQKVPLKYYVLLFVDAKEPQRDDRDEGDTKS